MPHTLLTEEELTYAIKFRYKIGADGLYSRYALPVYKVIFANVGHTRLAEELLQQTFAFAWNHIDEFQHQDLKLNCWMMGIARRLSKSAVSQSQLKVVPPAGDNQYPHLRIRKEYSSRVAI